MSFTFIKLNIPDIILIKPKVICDKRGDFTEIYKSSIYKKNGIEIDFVQTNRTKSSKGVIRGLHFQIYPKEQAKLIRVISGKIFDVIVDIRKKSKTFGKWIGIILNSKENNILYVPAGFAHGYSVLSKKAEIEYYCSNEYAPNFARGIKYNDPSLRINWKIKNPLLSNKDLKLPLLSMLD